MRDELATVKDVVDKQDAKALLDNSKAMHKHWLVF